MLSDAERSFFTQARPLGFILFARNCDNPAQMRTLCAELRACVGWHCPILIDQEGGRVQRLKPPVWRGFPPMRDFGRQAESDPDTAIEALRFTILQLAEELVDCGVDVDCAPVLDVLFEGAHDVIGDRAFSADPAIVARLGLSVCRNLLAAGVVPVIKHIPGHGRAMADSHKDLPRVDASLEDLRSTDFHPFSEISRSDVGAQVWGMTAHIVYDALDPDVPCSASASVVADIIRGEIGFDGFLLSDDLDMDALACLGDLSERGARVLDAGCDAALHCSGKFEDMVRLAESVPNLSAKAQERLQNSLKSIKLAA